MASIKRISKCFQEVKRLTGDLLPEEKIDEFLKDIPEINIENYSFAIRIIQKKEKTNN